MAYGRLVHAGFPDADIFCQCCLVIPQASTGAFDANGKLSQLFRTHSRRIFSLPTLRQIPEAQLSELQSGH
jgi:hypothetical protein